MIQSFQGIKNKEEADRIILKHKNEIHSMNTAIQDIVENMEKSETQHKELRETENMKSFEKIESLKEIKKQLKNQIKKHLTGEK